MNRIGDTVVLLSNGVTGVIEHQEVVKDIIGEGEHMIEYECDLFTVAGEDGKKYCAQEPHLLTLLKVNNKNKAIYGEAIYVPDSGGYCLYYSPEVVKWTPENQYTVLEYRNGRMDVNVYHRDSVKRIVTEKASKEAKSSFIESGCLRFLKRAYEISDNENELVECNGCHKEMGHLKTVAYDGGRYCKACVAHINVTCSYCKATIDLTQHEPCEFEGDQYCRNCFEDISFECSDCLQRKPIDEKTIAVGRSTCKACARLKLENSLIALPRGYSTSSFHSSNIFTKNSERRYLGIESELITDGVWDNNLIPTGWKVVSDASLNDGGVEFVSSPANGDKLFGLIDSFSVYAQRNSMYPDDSCGLHVHVDARDVNIDKMKCLTLLVSRLEQDWLYELAGDRRKDGEHGGITQVTPQQILSCKYPEDFIVLWYNELGNSSFSQDKYNSARYRGLNLHSRFVYGTIEFRHHEGTYDEALIKQWSRFCASLVGASKKIEKALNNDSRARNGKKLLEYAMGDKDYDPEHIVRMIGFKGGYDYLKKRNLA